MSYPSSPLKKIFAGLHSIRQQVFHNPYKKIGISWFTTRYFKYLVKPGLHSHILFSHQTYFYGIPEYFHGLREIFVDEVYKQVLPNNAFVIDCGAHIGLSVLYMKKICPSAHIIAFEPDKKNFTLLQKNVESHQLKQVELRNEAVWNKNTFLNFIHDRGMSSKIGDAEENTSSVQAVRLKEVITRKVDFLKLDIEGAEYAVMKDISGVLHHVEKIFLEYHGKFHQSKELSELLAILADDGFYFDIKEATAVHPHPFYMNKTNENFDIQLNIFAFRS